MVIKLKMLKYLAVDLKKICLAMQAENAVDQRDWIEKITGVISLLLSSQTPETVIDGIFF